MKKFVFISLFIFALSLPVSASEELRLPVVMYHHVSPDPGRWNDYVVSVDEFSADMEYLSNRGWESISLTELLAWSRGEFTMPEKPFMITFDDGFTGVAEYAEPILAKCGFKGVMAIIGSVCEEYSLSGDTHPAYSHLSWEAAKAMVERGVLELQCHSYDMHSMSAPMGCSKGRGEGVEHYRGRLSSDLGRFLYEAQLHELPICMGVAYPFGAYNQDTTDVIRDMGFAAAFTCAEKINFLTGDADELYHLGRYNRPHGIPTEKFFENWEKSLDIG